MLKTILSISGRPGLFKLVSNNKTMLIVESLQDGKKTPVHSRDRIVSLGDISIYTEDDEVPLYDVLVAIKKKENGQLCSTQPNAKADDLRVFFQEVLPNFDRDRVYPTDIKKMIGWYNLLVNANIDFEKADSVEENPSEETSATEEEK